MGQKKVLILDDQERFNDSFNNFISLHGYSADSVYTIHDAQGKIRNNEYDVVFFDIRLPDGNGLELFESEKRLLSESIVFIMTAFADLDAALNVLRNGAFDMLLKPFDLTDALGKMEKALEYRQLKEFSYSVRRHILESPTFENIIGKSAKIHDVISNIKRVAPLKTTVLIEGESGTGKELVAHAIHNNSDRADKLPIIINCAAIPEQLLESEFFGHMKGSFTGAISDKKGCLIEADHSTLILDEIGELPLEMQPKLLRALEYETVKPIGSATEKKVDIRLICMTNRDLKEEAAKKRFREDLYHRISAFPINIPPLRERKEDIPLLIDHFIKKHSRVLKVPVSSIDSTALQYIMQYEWTGNVRELSNIIERACILTDSDTIRINALPEFPSTKSLSGIQSEDLKKAVDDFTKRFINRILLACDNDKKEAAKRMNISLTTLYEKLKDN